jgi:hypothetical protein
VDGNGAGVALIKVTDFDVTTILRQELTQTRMMK